ncbi:MAG: winged helix-turn-helix domain-containing protein [Candidatus Acidiferrales bacterium]
MATPVPAPTKIRFDAFELDVTSGELRKAGILLKLQPQPFRVLLLLIERAGQVVTREEIQRCLWTDSTFVDFEHGINFSINQIRGALVDSAENPRYVETIPRRGYRFIGRVEQPSAGSISAPKPALASELETAAPRRWRLIATKHKVGLGAVILIILALSVVAEYGIHSLFHHRHAIPFQDFEITQLTTNGKTALAAISPDGNYLVSVVVDDGKSSLWLRHIQTNSDTQVIPPADGSYGEVSFSADGSYIYFLKVDEYGANDLFRVPVLGGTPQVLARDVDSNPVFSPGGDRIAFLRINDPDLNMYRLIVSNSDGTNERVVARGPMLDAPLPVAWSSDGKQFLGIQPGIQPAYPSPPIGGSSIASFDVASGQQHPLAAFDDLLVDMVPVPVEQGFLVLYRSRSRDFRGQQIGFVSPSASKLWAVTRDTNDYATMTLSSDGKTLVTVQRKDDPALYLLPTASYAVNPPNQVLAQQNDISDFAWASNTELYVARRSGLFRASIDGSSNVPLILDPHATVSHVASCGPGRFAAFAWAGHGDGHTASNLWRVDAAGSSPKQIVNDENYDAVEPVCSPDGKWLYYVQDQSGVFRVSTGSGTRQLIAGSASSGFSSNGFLGPDVSFDGKLLVFCAEKQAPSKPELWHEMLIIVSLDSGGEPSTRMIEAINGFDSGPRFTPDGKALVHAILETGYENSPHGIDNLWLQPLDGSPGHRITNFTSGRIKRIQFSPDGQRLGILRIHTKSDVVLLHDTGVSSQ